MTTTHLFT